MNKLNLNKTLAAGIFAATIITITACGGGGGGSSATASTKITTIAGGGDSTTGTNPAQAKLGSVSNLVVREGKLLFNANRDGTYKLQMLDVASNQLALPAAYSNIGAGETILHLLAANDNKYYFTTFLKAYGLYEADSTFAAKHIAGKNDAPNSGFVENDRGLLTYINPSNHAVIYNDGTNDLLFFIDNGKIRKVTLSGTYPTATVNDDKTYFAWRMALNGDKLLATAQPNSIIFEYDLKTAKQKLVAGVFNSNGGYENAVNPLQAKLNNPYHIAISPSGNIYFTVYGVALDSQRIIRKVTVNNGVYGAVTTAFGAAPGSTADSAELNNILDLEFVGDQLFLVDSDVDAVRRIKKIEFAQKP